MPMVFLGERPYSGSVGHILLGDARIGGENQIEGARIMTAFYSYMVDQPAILDRDISELLPMVLCSWREYVARRREMRVWEGDNSEEDADSCFGSNVCRWA